MLNGNGAVTAYQRRARSSDRPTLADSDAFRDIAAMPDGQGYVVLDEYGTGPQVRLRHRRRTPSGRSAWATTRGRTRARSIAVTPDGKGYVILLADGNVLKFGSAATGAMAALGPPAWPGADTARSHRGDARRRRLPRARQPRRGAKYGSALLGAVGTGSTPLVDDRPRTRRRHRVGVRHRVRLLRARRAGAASSARSGLASGHQPRRVAVPRPLARRSRSTAGSRCWCATTARPQLDELTVERRRSRLEHDDGAQHLAALHLVERLLHRRRARSSRCTNRSRSSRPCR